MPPRRSTNGKECTRSGDNLATTKTDNNKGHGLSSLSLAPVTAGKEPDHERLTGGQGLQGNLTSRVISNPPQLLGFLSGVDQLSLGLEAPGSGLEGRRVGQPSSTRDQMVGDLLDQLAGLEDLGAPADQINLVQRRLNQTIWAFSAQESLTPYPSVIERARKMQRDTLIGMRDPPRLNRDRPTAAEVEQWIKDLNMALRTNECGLDTYHRIVWVISLLLGNGLRDLINSAVQLGEITTLA
ncbi:hypothetical protein K504DRAFT_524526 [Pleomassaria siparia CBS 279.74]|uniref:Uncharacterized protein n=1 Tax=Pleomassaria siparia CBS 279.74 TaxID=1314801 RepID=A0A6G1JQI4_9PLEO|nr:hypothetical protein K504DRAFT_524526 [Pleomassaria siparia CBS 279.74]